MFTGVDPFVGCQRCHLFGDHAASPQEKALHAKVDLKKDPSFSHETKRPFTHSYFVRQCMSFIAKTHQTKTRQDYKIGTPILIPKNADLSLE